MRYLRDTTFVAWMTVIVILAGGLWYAAAAGRPGTTLPLTGADPGIVVGAERSDTGGDVDKLRGLAPHGVAAGADPDALRSWATGIRRLAASGQATRAREGADDGDQLLQTFAGLREAADALTASAHDPVAAASYRTRILMLIDRAGWLVEGRPVPGQLPAPALQPHGSLAPQVPVVPMPGTRPTPAAPLPGAGHPHPAPDLTPDPPTGEDLTP